MLSMVLSLSMHTQGRPRDVVGTAAVPRNMILAVRANHIGHYIFDLGAGAQPDPFPTRAGPDPRICTMQTALPTRWPPRSDGPYCVSPDMARSGTGRDIPD